MIGPQQAGSKFSAVWRGMVAENRIAHYRTALHGIMWLIHGKAMVWQRCISNGMLEYNI